MANMIKEAELSQKDDYIPDSYKMYIQGHLTLNYTTQRLCWWLPTLMMTNSGNSLLHKCLTQAPTYSLQTLYPHDDKITVKINDQLTSDKYLTFSQFKN